jgi:antitoxin component YwqK of YwqJK toxin-antitoxin module
MEPNIRIAEDLIEWDGDIRLYNGQPFTGVGFSLNQNGQLELERHYKDGFEEGLCREWYSNGQLELEYFAIRGLANGRLTKWHKHGQVKSIDLCEHGIVTKYEEWDESGTSIKKGELDKKSVLYSELERRRKNGN